jgi:hypothetical protein
MKREMVDIRKVGMQKGLLYETIITTKNVDNIPNAAPIGVICKSEEEIIVYLHHGSHTLDNIKLQKKFVVNIVKDPETFVQCTISDPSSEYFKKYKDQFVLRNADGFFITELTDIKEVEKKDQLGVSRLSIIKAYAKEVIINEKCVKPFNRASFAVIESLIYLTRLELVDKDTRLQYIERIREMSKLVNKVGGSKHKKAMQNLLDFIER